jgi:hypothetical protein
VPIAIFEESGQTVYSLLPFAELPSKKKYVKRPPDPSSD